MVELLVLIGRALVLACHGHHELALENMALRRLLSALKRTTKRPCLRTRDRLFWVLLARLWRNWRTALVHPLVGSSRFPKSVVSITDMSDVPRKSTCPFSGHSRSPWWPAPSNRHIGGER
jgi:hypothetical protein